MPVFREIVKRVRRSWVIGFLRRSRGFDAIRALINSIVRAWDSLFFLPPVSAVLVQSHRRRLIAKNGGDSTDYELPSACKVRPRINEAELILREYSNVWLLPQYGCLYDACGCRIDVSVFRRGYRPNMLSAPETIDVKRLKRGAIVDSALYGGILSYHFGHFLTESLARLWPLVEDRCLRSLPLLYFGYGATGKQPKFVRELITGVGSPKMIKVEHPIRIKKILIPDASWVGFDSAHTIHRRLCRYASRNIVRPESKKVSGFEDANVYLSRSRLPIGRYAKILREKDIEKELMRKGVKVVYPEQLSFGDQIHLFEVARCVGGCIGSAFHTMLCADFSGIELRYFCKANQIPNVNYFNADAICGVEGRYYECLR